MSPMNPRLLRPRATGFNPRTVAGLEAWWDAADASSITLDSGRVSTWADKSGNSRNATNSTSGSTQPDYITGAKNGRSVLRFARASSQRLVVGSSTATFKFMHSEPTTVFCVALPGSALNTAIGVAFANTNLTSDQVGYSLFYNDASTNNDMADVFVTNGLGAPSVIRARVNNSFTQGVYALYSVITRPANATEAERCEIRKNSGIDEAAHLSSTGTLSTANASGNLTIGGAASLEYFWGGDICEVLIYKGALNAGDRQRVEGYLARKWGVTLP